MKNSSDGYEPDTEQEKVIETEEDDEDDSDIPKKRKKPKVRDLVKTQRDGLAIPDDMDVSTTSLELSVGRLGTHISCLIRFVKTGLPRA